jgi:hypothetical protein
MDAPIFIVGVQRSGTTLLAAMLAAHSRMSCGPETHFFRRLLKNDAGRLCNPQTWPRAAVEFVCSITHTSYQDDREKLLLEKYRLTPDQIEAYLANKEPLIDNILSSVTEQYMLNMGKCRWVEKTPDHIKSLDMIRKYFPQSPIIRIIRDPRDVAISMQRVPWGARSYFEGLLFWKHLDAKSADFFTNDSLCYTLRYEDLVTTPQRELGALCHFIGEDFEEQMLDTSVTGKQINSRNVPWKDQVSQPVDPNRVAVWRTQLSPAENQIAEALLGDRLDSYNYPRLESLDQFGEIYPYSALTDQYVHEIRHIISTGVRFWKVRDGEQPAVQVLIGYPREMDWARSNGVELFINTFSITLSLYRSRIANRTLYWIPDGSENRWTGFSASMLKKILEPYKINLNN